MVENINLKVYFKLAWVIFSNPQKFQRYHPDKLPDVLMDDSKGFRKCTPESQLKIFIFYFRRLSRYVPTTTLTNKISVTEFYRQIPLVNYNNKQPGLFNNQSVCVNLQIPNQNLMLLLYFLLIHVYSITHVATKRN